MPQPPAGRPAGGPPANRPSTVRPGGAPQPAARPAAAPAAPPSQRVARPAAPAPAPPSQRVQPVPARPPSPGTQRITKTPAAPPPAPPSQRVQPVAAKPSTGTQRIPKPAAPGAGEASGPPSTKSVKPARSSGTVLTPVAPAVRVPMTRKKLLLNLSIWLSIPICIAVISIQLYRKGAKKMAKDLKGAVTTDKTPDNQGPQVSDEQKALDAVEDIRKEAGKNFAIANLDKTTDPERKVLYEKILALDNEYREKIQKYLDDPKYQDKGHEYLSDGLTEINQRARVVKDWLRASAPPPEEVPAEPNTRALGAISSWNGTKQKLSLLLLPKDASPADPTALAAEYPQTIGHTGAELKDLPVDRIWELLKGDLKTDTEKLEGDAKAKKCEELAKGIQVFEGQKLTGGFEYLKSIQGYYFKDQLARVRTTIHDDRGVSSFAEYYKVILLAIGSPAKGLENVSASVCEWRLTWRQEGVVYRLNAIGTKNGMDLIFTAYNEANWKLLAETLGDKDVFEEDKQEDWADRTPKEPPK